MRDNVKAAQGSKNCDAECLAPTESKYGNDTFVRVHLDTPKAKEDGTVSRRAKRLRRGQLWLRVGTEKPGRSPVWAVWPIVLHRLWSPKGQIQRVMVSRRRVGPRWHWTAEFTVKEELGPAVPLQKHPGGVVGVDIGWRRLKGGGLRVAAWHDGDEAGELVLSEKDLKYARYPDTNLKSVRDKIRGQLQAGLCSELESYITCMELPDWFRQATVKRREGLPTSKEAISTIRKWNSPSKFARLCRIVREQLDDNPQFGRIYQILEDWRYRDYHLWTWEAHQRRKWIRRRREKYRLFAYWLVHRYDTIVFERFNLAKMARRKPKNKETAQQEELANSWRHLACTHQLRDCVRTACKRYDSNFEEVMAVDSTRECHNCGSVVRFDAAKYIDRTPPCPVCSDSYDQDKSAGKVLRKRWIEKRAVAPPKRKRNSRRREGESRWQFAKRMKAERDERMKKRK